MFVIKEGLKLELNTIAKECGYDTWKQLLYENFHEADIFIIVCEYFEQFIDDYRDMFLDLVADKYERHDLVNLYNKD